MAKIKSLNDDTPGLPEDIIQHILSFLTTKEATQTSVLSKAWYHACQTCPTIRFNESWSPHHECHKKFLNSVHKVLIRYHEQNIGIHTFKLYLNSAYSYDKYSFDAPLVNSCIDIAAERGLKKLVLNLENLELSLKIFAVKSLEDLSLWSCRIKLQVTEINIRCYNLRRLVLGNVNLYDDMFQKIMSSCPLIEDLEIWRCGHLENIKIINLQILRRLYIRCNRDQIVEVEAPSLRFFTCISSGATLLRGGMPKFFPPQNLKSLVLGSLGITEIFLCDFTLKFPQLESLEIDHCNCLQRIDISSSSLRIITLKFNRELKELKVDAPNIVQFNFCGARDSIPLVSLTRGASRCKCILDICSRKPLDNSWFIKLKELLTNLAWSKVFLHINCYSFVTFNVDEIREGSTFPGLEIEELKITVDAASTADIFPSLLDGCFWSCRPKTVSQLLSTSRSVVFVKLLYNMLMERRNQNDNNLQAINFWQRQVRGVNFVIFKMMGQVWHPEDWEGLLKASIPLDYIRSIKFNLVW